MHNESEAVRVLQKYLCEKYQSILVFGIEAACLTPKGLVGSTFEDMLNSKRRDQKQSVCFICC